MRFFYSQPGRRPGTRVGVGTGLGGLAVWSLGAVMWYLCAGPFILTAWAMLETGLLMAASLELAAAIYLLYRRDRRFRVYWVPIGWHLFLIRTIQIRNR
jgi:hypothetical protein